MQGRLLELPRQVPRRLARHVCLLARSLQLRTHADQLAMACTPDVLVLPSKLGAFAKSVGGCLVVNPGQLCKGASAGTFASGTLRDARTVSDIGLVTSDLTA